ncbi:MAG: hypothetical protein R3C30_07565 [Hyphomonadaceae bacterium]
MQPRSVELLETIKRSPKQFTEYDVLDFAREITRLSVEERAALFARRAVRAAAEAKKSAGPKLPRGITADRAKTAILSLLEDERPNVIKSLKAAEKKSYAALCRGLVREGLEADLPTMVKRAIENYSGTTSSNWARDDDG